MDRQPNLMLLCFTLVAAFLFPVFAGCDRGTEVEKQGVLKAVKDYNLMLQMAYLQADLALMPNFATEAQIKKLFPVIQALRATQNSMVAEQTDFALKRISVSGDKATVTTREVWVYWWQNKDTGSVTKPKETITYEIRYHLTNDAGKWKVDRLEEN